MSAAAASASDLASLSDTGLAHRVAAGDASAFQHVMRRYNRMLFRTARAILKDDAEAEDALQDAYLIAYGAIATFRGDAKLSTWLVRIVANEALARLRKRTRRAAIVPLRHDNGEIANAESEMDVPDIDTPERAASRGDMRRLIEAKIDELPDAFRAVFVLRAVEELSVEETAACLGLNEATVRTRFFRARGLLRAALAHEIDHAVDGAFGFAGERCDNIVARVMAKLAELRDVNP